MALSVVPLVSNCVRNWVTSASERWVTAGIATDDSAMRKQSPSFLISGYSVAARLSGG